MQVLVRSTASARPRVTSPGRPVSAAAASLAPSIWIPRLAKGIHRDCLVPGLRIVSFTHADLARRIDGAGTAALDLDEYPVLRLINAGLREGVTGRDGVVAGAQQLWRRRRRARDQVRHRGGAGLGLGICCGCGFGDAAAKA